MKTSNYQENKTIKANILVRKDIQDSVWVKCPECNEIIYNGELDRNLRICKRCSYYFPMSPLARISFLIDDGSFHKFDGHDCPDIVECERVFIGGKARLSNYNIVISAVNIEPQYDFDDITVGNKIIRAISYATEKRLPLLIIYTIGNDPQNKEYFLGQKLSISATLSKFNKEKLAYISVLSQSSANSNFPAFAYSADIVIAESRFLGTSHTGSRIGRREAESAVKTLFESGVIDMVVMREDLKAKIIDILHFFY